MNLVTTSEYDFNGQEVSITQSKNNEILGIKGKVIMDTKNMIIIIIIKIILNIATAELSSVLINT